MTVLVRHIKFLEKAKRHKEAGMLRAIGAGATWNPHRKYMAGLIKSPLCPRCLSDQADSIHDAYTCPNNALIQSRAVNNEGTKNLERRGETGAVNLPCCWLRGIAPMSDICKLELPFGKIQGFGFLVKEVNALRQAEGGRVFLDGSGREPQTRERRCGWSVAVFGTH